MLKSIKFRLYPTQKQEELLEQQFGACRFVWNLVLSFKEETYKDTKETLSKNYLDATLPFAKEEYGWLTEVNSQSLQQELKHLDSAYQRFFKKLGGYPKFKSKRDKQSFSIPQHFRLEDNTITIPKIKNIKTITSKDIKNFDLRSITVSKTKTNKYFASINYDDGMEVPTKQIPKKENSLGIDLGIKHFAVFSNGEKIDNPKFFEKDQKHLRRLQQSLSRKEKTSSNRTKARFRVATLHERIANKRSDFLHQLTHKLTCENQEVNTLCVEDLNVKGMVKNHKLAKSISSVSWGEFLRQLSYKSEWNGVNLLQCGRFEPSSKICNNCGWKNDNLQLSDRFWTCAACGCEHDRDINASKNVRDFAFASLEAKIPRDARNFKSVEMETLIGVNFVANEISVCETETRFAKIEESQRL